MRPPRQSIPASATRPALWQGAFTVLFGAHWAERLRLAYEAEAGRAIDP
jgi:hypothetical protein